MFRNDYSEAGAPEVLEALGKICLEQNVGYGLDRHSKRAGELILEKFGLSEDIADVHFLAGGTQANAVTISYFLRPFEGVIACDTGHINVHETGAVEGSGHKVYTCRNRDGKLLAEDIEKAMLLHRDEHMVKLRMVYISDSTETGTIYTSEELTKIRKVCDKYGLLLFIDGARLGVALTSPGNDVTPDFIGRVSDIFYVGGTKNGALIGEAIVIKKSCHAEDFRYHIKNRCAMLAKGFVLGIEFETLFEDAEPLYFKLAKNSNDTAVIIRNGLEKLGLSTVGNSNTNQIFICIKKALAEKLMDRYGVELWEDRGDELVIRIVTSFATKKDDCAEFIAYLGKNL